MDEPHRERGGDVSGTGRGPRRGYTGVGGHPVAGSDYDQTTVLGLSTGVAETVLTLDSTPDTGSILG